MEVQESKLTNLYTMYYNCVRMIHAFNTNTTECDNYTKQSIELKYKIERLNRKNW
jgi:hypothetical protein